MATNGDRTNPHSDILISSPALNIIPFSTSNTAHNEFLVALWNNPLFISTSGKTGIDTPEKAKSFIERRWIAEYRRNGYGTYVISLNTSSGPQLIGTVGLTKGDSPTSFSVPDLGFAILPEFNGKGYATEASKLLLEWAKAERGVNEAFGLCDPGNVGSRKVLEKVGLQFRGVRKLTPFGGVEGAVYALPHMDEDLAVYGLME